MSDLSEAAAGARTTKLWCVRMEIVYEADGAEQAAETAAEITDGVLSHEAVWSADVAQDLEPKETVDV